MGIRTKTRGFIARKRYPMKIYKPVKKEVPKNILQVNSAWKGLE